MIDSNVKEWNQSAIAPSLIKLNLEILTEEEIAEWYFQYLRNSARRNDGRIRDGYLRAYKDPLRGGWGIKGRNPTNLDAEPELRVFKPNYPRIDKSGKEIKYDAPKNSKHHPIFPRVSYEIAAKVCRKAGVSFLAMTQKYAPGELITGVDDEAECKWFWAMVLDTDEIPLTIAEGGKKQLCLLSQGYCAIALTSITTWGQGKGSNKLHPWLSLFASKRRFYISFDQDSKKATKKAVNRQSFKLGDALIKAGAIRVKRITWSGTAKGIDDFLFSLHQKYGEVCAQNILDKCYECARDYKTFSNSDILPGRIKTVNKRYLEVSDVKEEANYKLLAIKAAKGSGKTVVLSELVAGDRRLGIPTINLSHLERLAREQGIRIGIPYRTENNTVTLRNALGYSLCFDSFSPYNSVPFLPAHWTDAGLALDEFTQVLRHGAFGQTEIKNYRKVILATLGQKLADCWKNNKPIRLLDADADAESIELIYELIQLYSDEPITREELESETLTVVNEYRPQKGDLHFYDEPSPKQILADLTMLMKNKENILILSSSQKIRSADGTINLEKKARKYYDKSEILRIDSQTTSDPEHPAFGITGHILADMIKAGKYKIVIASPTICTGISIDGVDGVFNAVFSFQAGNLTTNSVRQQLVRLRDFQVPRYVWCPKIGKSFIGCNSTNPIELLANQKGEGKLSLGFLGYKEAENIINSNLCPLTKYWAKVGAKQNYENYHYREILLGELEAEGWNIIIRNRDESSKEKKKQLNQIWEERKEIKQSSVKEDNIETANSKDLTPDEAATLENKGNLREVEGKQLKKHQIKQRYGVSEVTEELVDADSKKLFSGLKLRFWLTDGRKYVEDNDRDILEKMKQRNGGSFFIPDMNKKLNVTKIKLLELCDLDRFLKEGTEWSNKSPELIKLQEFVFKHLARFNQILGCGIAITDSPITVIQKILKRINQRLPYLRNLRDGEKRLRIYGSAKSKLDVLSQHEERLFNKWLEQCKAKFDVPEVASV
ncbi:MAG: DUF3854 domain-containing protein [Xenococcaceae cyanobacterium MO_207.B15]|nr:DUF3854 domain-containing protein [Xenococcaceae cyanobacterium MO_207.B15]